MAQWATVWEQPSALRSEDLSLIHISLNGTDYKVVVDTEETTVTPAEPGKTETPVQNTDTAQPTENEENIETSEGVKTGDSANMALPIICIVAAGCAAVYTGLRIKRRML